MQVRVTAADGGVANASAFVHVGTAAPGIERPNAPKKLAVEICQLALVALQGFFGLSRTKPASDDEAPSRP